MASGFSGAHKALQIYSDSQDEKGLSSNSGSALPIAPSLAAPTGNINGAGIPDAPKQSASEMIGEGLGRTFALPGQGEGLWNRAGGLLETAGGILGLPQQAGSRIVGALAGQGTEVDYPSEIIGNALGTPLNPLAAFTTDLLIDPTNLFFGAGAAKTAIKGSFLAETAYNLERKLPALQYAAKLTTEKQPYQLFFSSQEEIAKLQAAARTDFKPFLDESTGLFSLDLVNVEHLADVGLERQKLLSTLDGSAQMSKVKLDQLESKYKTFFDGEGKPLPGVKHKIIHAFNKWFINNWSHSDWLTHTTKIMEDSGKARVAWHGKEAAVFEDLSKGLHFKGTNSSAFDRAAGYYIFDQEHLFEVDQAAKNAAEAFGKDKLRQQALSIQNRLLEVGRQLPQKENSGISGINALVKKISQMGIDDIGLKSDQLDKVFEGAKITPQNINTVDLINQVYLRTSKHLFNRPAEKAVEAIVKLNDKGLNALEKDYIKAMLGHFRGKPSQLDVDLVNTVLNSKEQWRKSIWGEKMARQLAEGKLAREAKPEKLWQKALAGVSEKVIGAAENATPFATQGVLKARKAVYNGLLGAAIDSSVRNLTQVFNTMTKYGYSKTIQGLGATARAAFDSKFGWVEELEKLKTPQAKMLLMQDVVKGTNSYLTELFEDLSIKTGFDWQKRIMAPMHAAEYVNRGTAFYAGLAHHMEQGLPIRQAIEAAVQGVRETQFSYSALDMSPFVNNPLGKLFIQFQTYPIRQLQFLADSMKTGLTPRNQFIRYLALTGAAVANGQRLGIDMADVVGVGLGLSDFPQDGSVGGVAGWLPQPDKMMIPAVIGGVNNAFNIVKRGFQWLNTGSIAYMSEGGDESRGWREILDLSRMLVPGGRYASKALKEVLEGTRTDAGWLGSLLGVDVDPGVNWHDRMTRLLGFTTTRDSLRKDQLKFLGSFIQTYHSAVEDLNNTVIKGGDVEKAREKWVKRIHTQFYPKMEEYNLPDYVVWQRIRPSDEAYLTRKRTNLDKNSEQILIDSFPKEFKQFMTVRDRYK